MFNDTSSPLALLRTRRSGKARDMAAPGPSPEQLADIVAIATRVPDHGKLNPWRIVAIPLALRDAFGARIVAAYRAERPEAGRLEIETFEAFARQAPVMLALLSTPVASSKIPLWEQQLSAGAMAMQLMNAAHAHGFVANWLTGWAAGSDAMLRTLGGTGADDRIIGYVFIGSPVKALEERPRPDIGAVFSEWRDD